MKINLLECLVVVLVSLTINSTAQSGIGKTSIATLGPGEKLANNEYSFLLSSSPEAFSFVTITGSGTSKQYYCYGKDGTKTGPFKQPDPSFWAGSKGTRLEDCMAVATSPVDDPGKYIDYTSGSVSFNGTKYGPYGQVMMFYLSKDQKSFYAIALTTEMKIVFFDNRNRKKELVTVPEEVLVSPDGSRAFAKTSGEVNMFDPEALQKLMENPEALNNPKISLVGIDGSKYGPFTSDNYKDAWFTPAGQLIVYDNNGISLDGKLLFKPQEHLSKCDIWIGSNGKDYAYADYTNLIFSDGTKMVAPIVIEQVTDAGKNVLKWISLENGKELVFYKKLF